MWRIALVMLLTGCAMGPRVQRLSPGMAEADVIAIMGRPDGVVVEGDYRALQWANRLMSEWSNDRADYWVVLAADTVVAYGPGNVRPGPSPHTLILVPVSR